MKQTKLYYRGTGRHQELRRGDILKYDYPTSWTADQEIAESFVEGVEDPVILILDAVGTIRGIHNYMNTYDEAELILGPVSLEVLNRGEVDGYIYLTVAPIKGRIY